MVPWRYGAVTVWCRDSMVLLKGHDQNILIEKKNLNNKIKNEKNLN